MKWKAFFIIFKGLPLKQIKVFFGMWESDFKLNTRNNGKKLLININNKAFFLLKANESSGFDDLNVKCCQEMLWRNQWTSKL